MNFIAKGRLLLLALLIACLPLCAGCGASAQAAASKLWEEWLDEQNLNPNTFMGVANLARRAAGRDLGSKDANATADLIILVGNIKLAEDAMDQGHKLQAQGRLGEAEERMNAALQLRMADWTYHVARGALALEAGDPMAANYFTGGEAIRFRYAPKAGAAWVDRNIVELESVASRMSPDTAPKATCTLLYSRLSEMYAARRAINGGDPQYNGAGDQAAAWKWDEARRRCPK